MKIKLRKQTSDGLIKFENKTQIKDVFVNAEAVDSKKEAIAIAFKGANDSGFIELSRDERIALMDLLEEVRMNLAAKFSPDGFNIGINDESAAGQTVMHLHMHVIPRYSGDVLDPRGGIRWIFPEMADYWSKGES